MKAGFWDSLINGIKSFFASFLTDYTVLGKAGEGERALSVWLTSSRDQANLLKSMLDEDFTPQSGIRVQLSLVDSGLTEAVMAGRGRMWRSVWGAPSRSIWVRGRAHGSDRICGFRDAAQPVPVVRA